MPNGYTPNFQQQMAPMPWQYGQLQSTGVMGPQAPGGPNPNIPMLQQGGGAAQMQGMFQQQQALSAQQQYPAGALQPNTQANWQPADAFANNNKAAQQAYWAGQGPQSAPNPTQYGYAQAPGGSLGYYEQQTPVGSFAAANQQWSQGAQPAGQQLAFNPFVGQTSQGIGGQGSVMPWAQQIGQQATQQNPFLGQTSAPAQGAGQNPFGVGNPHLQQAIDAASQDAIRNFNMGARPALDSAMRASGSFGNSAIQELQQNAYSDLGRNLGNIASGMRMQDYTQQQQLAENSLNRTQANNQFNAGLGAADLNRNLGGWLSGQGLGLQGLGQQLGAAQFDATLGNSVAQFNAGLGQADLSRNAQLAQGLGQFNAGQGNQMGQFNANLLQNNSQFNTSQGNALNQFNTGAANQMLGQYRNLEQQQNQFDDTFNLNAWQANQNNMRAGTQDQLALINAALGWQGLGVNAATQIQNTPMQYWQQFLGGATQAGGLGGSASQQLYGNPLLGALGGWQLAGQFLGNGGAPRVGG